MIDIHSVSALLIHVIEVLEGQPGTEQLAFDFLSRAIERIAEQGIPLSRGNLISQEAAQVRQVIRDSVHKNGADPLH